MSVDHEEVRRLADADQSDRTTDGRTLPAAEDRPAIARRDRERRRRVAELIDAGAPQTGADY